MFSIKYINHSYGEPPTYSKSAVNVNSIRKPRPVHELRAHTDCIVCPESLVIQMPPHSAH